MSRKQCSSSIAVSCGLMLHAHCMLSTTAHTLLPSDHVGMLAQVAAYAFGRGPLALKDCPWLGDLKKFGAVLSFPVIPKAAFKISKGSSVDSLSSTAPTTPSSFLYSYCCKSAGAAAAAAMAIWPALPILLNHWFYALCLSLSLGAIWDFWCFMTALWFGVEPAPSFDKPWLSTSFADYWSRRWNLTVTYMLRVLIYEPVMEGRLVPADVADSSAEQHSSKAAGSLRPSQPPAAAAAPAGPEEEASAVNGIDSKPTFGAVAPTSTIDISATAGAVTATSNGHHSSADTLKKCTPAANGSQSDAVSYTKASSSGSMTKKQRLLRRLAALQATFAFSGIWHLLIFYYATGLVTWHWFAFFSVQAPIMAVEAILIKYAKSKNFALKRPLAIFLTNFLLIVVANPLFFGPCDWSGMCTAIWSNVKGSPVA
eukprot:GHUV01018710.1.p1 GENE.GHUV01018710.1~~GHUV01018710.1.p1  ORF type:complete len:426 (+),score=120.91 GHUV01018710.1:134-1411(+)